ncbi:hypothetical protein SAMN06264855_10744 [Halorubrum vacuolatum]|uniref:DUF5786 domain-containing protein n=2 Tax=Halorubrum vacuolatum TaxID=63740 RepID=A0A238WD98_HALVU|nr:hypothetical protein SAMN06264855_10744 [Halorubrum vacuolatum]
MCTMSMGAYDEDEHERREQKTATVDADFDAERAEYSGSITYDSGDSTEALLDKFQELQGK